jgi:transposase
MREVVVSGSAGRAIGLEVHRDFCEVAICESGRARSAGRVETAPDVLELLAGSLGPEDRVAMEVTGGGWEIARILEPHVWRVVVVSPDDTGIRQARAKTDRLDARTLARLLWTGELDAVWMPDERCRVMRRRLARREQLVRSRSRSKNEIHAVLMRRLKGKPPFGDLFGVKGRRWLGELVLPVEEAETVAGALRHVEFLDREIAAVERLVAREALGWPDARRLLTVSGVTWSARRRFWLRSAISAGFRPRGSWSPISGLTRGCASPASRRPKGAKSPSGVRRRPAGRWSRRRGASSVSPVGCTPSSSESASAAGTARPSSPPPASSRSCSGACSPAARTTPTSGHR